MTEQENNSVTNKTVEFIGIDIEKEKGKSETIKRIRFKCKEFDITYKPSILTDVYTDGITVKGDRQISVNEIPQKVKDIGKAIAKNKSCKVKVNYGIFDTEDREGDPVTYRYIRYPTELEQWEIEKIK